jgi:4-hydroxythreonine-4-phosphate dehydrogenase
MSNAPLVMTPGEPAGIGAEIALKAWKNEKSNVFFLLDNPERVRNRAKLAGLDIPCEVINSPSEAKDCFPEALPILTCDFPIECAPGKPSTKNAPSVINTINTAVDFTQKGLASGIVTNPIQKHTLIQAGFKHPGHTEFLAHLADGSPTPVMLLVSTEIRVIPITIHEPISRVASLLTTDLIIQSCLIIAKSLITDFGIEKPRLWVAGLNPHAGENGSIGLEEKLYIEPALRALKEQQIDVSGPISADSMFHQEARNNYDAAVCMYHDQALIPLKTLDFWGGVNITIGLPFVRTSPDHGTALDIAGTGKANSKSLTNAISLAAKIANRRKVNTLRTEING